MKMKHERKPAAPPKIVNGIKNKAEIPKQTKARLSPFPVHQLDFVLYVDIWA